MPSRILSQHIEPGHYVHGRKVATVSVGSIVIVHTEDGNRHTYPCDYQVVVTSNG